MLWNWRLENNNKENCEKKLYHMEMGLYIHMYIMKFLMISYGFWYLEQEKIEFDILSFETGGFSNSQMFSKV